jgi:hypothetical protein
MQHSTRHPCRFVRYESWLDSLLVPKGDSIRIYVNGHLPDLLGERNRHTVGLADGFIDIVGLLTDEERLMVGVAEKDACRHKPKISSRTDGILADITLRQKWQDFGQQNLGSTGSSGSALNTAARDAEGFESCPTKWGQL